MAPTIQHRTTVQNKCSTWF